MGRAVVDEQRILGKRSALSTALSNLCGALLMLGELRAAGEAALEAWPIRQDASTGFQLGHIALLDYIAFMAVLINRCAEGAKILSRADAWYAQSQIMRLPNEARAADRARAAIKKLSDPAPRAIDLTDGEHLSDAQLDTLVRAVLTEATSI